MSWWRELLPRACLVVALICSAAHAQNIQNFKPAAGTWNFFSVEGARVAKHLEFVPSLMINYGNQPLTVRGADDEIDRAIVEHLATANILFTVGFVDYIEIGVDLPLHILDGEGLSDAEGLDGGFAVGDLRLLPKFRLFGLERDKGFGAAIAVPIEFPTGDSERFIGSDQFIVNPKLVLEARGAGFSFAANGGIRVRPDRDTVENSNLELGNEVTYGAGLGVEPGTDMVVIMAEVFGAAPISDISDDSRASPLEGLLGVRVFTHPGAVFTVGGGGGFVSDYGSPIWRVLFGFAWHDRNYDRDGDGILDKEDKCPDDPEDRDGFQDADGCPDPDNDEDGILDVDDQCPLDKEDHDGFQDEDGCPDPDNDGDKILDDVDQCPNQPETYNNWRDTDGCPDEIPDTDGDGILDPNDQCPNEPEDKDGFQDEDGCPDPDNDGDGIPDVSDQCPNEPETFNGLQDEDGCPDARVVLTKEKIEIKEKVFFDHNKATIKAVSFPLLNEVAGVILQNEYIKLVRVEGHTDSKGSDRYNKKLSQSRADSVRKYLIAQGVAPERLIAVGFGEEVPIDDNRTEAGRANNRRVEFTIMEQ